MKSIIILCVAIFSFGCGVNDTNQPIQDPFCGDGVCNGFELCSSCSTDCGPCSSFCGDGTCNANESCSSCSLDCGPCQPQCRTAGQVCDENANLHCCSGSLCVFDVKTPWDKSCADMCSYNSECYSGCCAPLGDSGYSVCSPPQYCL